MMTFLSFGVCDAGSLSVTTIASRHEILLNADPHIGGQQLWRNAREGFRIGLPHTFFNLNSFLGAGLDRIGTDRFWKQNDGK